MINFAVRSSLTKFLGRALGEGRLALFLGAGISATLQEASPGAWFGLPQWAEFLKNLYKTKSLRLPVGVSGPRLAEDFLSKCSGPREYRHLIRSALYRNFKVNISQLHKNATLAAIGALVSVSQRSRISRVVTLNFDDILERYLSHLGLIARPIFRRRFWHYSADVLIYHLHGFIPSPGSPFEVEPWEDASNEIVLDAFSYQKVFANQSHRFSLIAQDVMMSNYCLFLGLSDTDEHLGALLGKCKEANPYKTEGNSYWGVAFATKRQSSTVEYWRRRGIFLQQVADWNHDLPELLFSICQHAAKLRA